MIVLEKKEYFRVSVRVVEIKQWCNVKYAPKFNLGILKDIDLVINISHGSHITMK